MLRLESVLSHDNKGAILFWFMVRKWIAHAGGYSDHTCWSCCGSFIRSSLVVEDQESP
jgi:hypothetical protein